MSKLIGLALVCGLSFGGCKCSSESSSATSSNDDKPTATETSRPAGRSGKIDLGTRRNPPAGDTTDGDKTAGGSDTPRPSFEDRRAARLKEFDTDGDGKISEDERKVARHKRAEEMLKTADKNGDGKVTPDELAEGNFRRLDPQSVDTNKDGQVSADELEAALEARAKQWGAGRFGRLGNRLDPNGRFRPTPGSAGSAGSAAAPERTN